VSAEVAVRGYTARMSPPSLSPSVSMRVPQHLQPLVERLADLSNEDRELVIRAARSRRRTTVELKPFPWNVLWRASGTVSMGGDAVEHTNASYDV